MNSKIIVSKNIDELSEHFAGILVHGVDASINFFNIALSGGSTPKAVFDYLTVNYKSKIDWQKVKLFWGDERYVPPDNPESNYKMTYESLISRIEIPPQNIFRIHGENNPVEEAKNYANVIAGNVPINNSLPQFDLIMLGLGEDAHTASIFPDRLELLESDNICATVEHPSTKQKRITLTGKVINNSAKVVFLVTGKNKSKIVDTILNKRSGYELLPASFINPTDGELIWLLDSEAAKEFKNNLEG